MFMFDLLWSKEEGMKSRLTRDIINSQVSDFEQGGGRGPHQGIRPLHHRLGPELKNKR